MKRLSGAARRSVTFGVPVLGSAGTRSRGSMVAVSGRIFGDNRSEGGRLVLSGVKPAPSRLLVREILSEIAPWCAVLIFLGWGIIGFISQ